jgi:hypothetical protein
MLPMQTVKTRLNTSPKLPQVLDAVERSSQTVATMTSPRPSGNPGIRMHPDRPPPPKKNMPPGGCLGRGSFRQQTTSREPLRLRSNPVFSTTHDARHFSKQHIVTETPLGWAPRQQLIRCCRITRPGPSQAEISRKKLHTRTHRQNDFKPHCDPQQPISHRHAIDNFIVCSRGFRGTKRSPGA